MPVSKKKRQANDWSRLVDQVRAELVAAGNPKPKLKDVLQIASSRYEKKKPVAQAPPAPPAVAVVAEEPSVPMEEPAKAPVVAVAEEAVVVIPPLIIEEPAVVPVKNVAL
jgi:hypothetical protein